MCPRSHNSRALWEKILTLETWQKRQVCFFACLVFLLLFVCVCVWEKFLNSSSLVANANAIAAALANSNDPATKEAGRKFKKAVTGKVGI